MYFGGIAMMKSKVRQIVQFLSWAGVLLLGAVVHATPMFDALSRVDVTIEGLTPDVSVTMQSSVFSEDVFSDPIGLATGGNSGDTFSFAPSFTFEASAQGDLGGAVGIASVVESVDGLILLDNLSGQDVPLTVTFSYVVSALAGITNPSPETASASASLLIEDSNFNAIVNELLIADSFIGLESDSIVQSVSLNFMLGQGQLPAFSIFLDTDGLALNTEAQVTVPEPSSAVLLFIGLTLFGLIWLRKRPILRDG